MLIQFFAHMIQNCCSVIFLEVWMNGLVNARDMGGGSDDRGFIAKALLVLLCWKITNYI
jgi:hypothetical protein